MPVTASYSSAGFTLTATGTVGIDSITIGRNGAGTLLVNGGAVPVAGGPATVANTDLISASGGDGSDSIALDEAVGALPAAEFFGGTGNDTLTGGSAGDTLSGDTGDDTLFGRGGNDLLLGGSENDTLTGGDGDDQMFGGSGDDRLVWNPGDDSDVMEGEEDIDTVEVNGGNGAESFTATANGTRVRFDRIDPAPFTLDIGTTEHLVLNANGGDDSFAAAGDLASLITVTVDGGAGNDTLLGSNGADVLIGGDNNDFVDGNQGIDTLLLGNGDDVTRWDPGDGSDIVEGGAGTDTLQFNGSNIGESIALAANGGRVLLTRNVANIAMDLNAVEVFTVNALGGADVITIGSLVGTGVTQVLVNLASTLGGNAGDSALDTVTVDGSNGADHVSIHNVLGTMQVTGLAATVTVAQLETADVLALRGLSGADIISADEVDGPVAALRLEGGAGNDTLTGGASADTLLGQDDNDTLLGRSGADQLFGGIGNDTLTGGDGDDQLFGEAGNDRLVWNPGDDSDVIEGGDDIDTVEVNGGSGAEVFTATANGTRVRFDRVDPAPFALDIGTTEKLSLNAGGGNDSFSASGNLSPLISFTIDGSTGEDTLLGSNGADLLLGGDDADFIDGNQGNDTLLLGNGDDVARWDPGDGNDVVEGGAGTDRLDFNGSNIAEKMALSANGGRALFTRDVAAITLDLNDLERIDINALGGADTISIGNLAATDVKQITVNLAGTIGGASADGALDTVEIDGSIGGNVIAVTASVTGVLVSGLSATVALNQVDATDTLVVRGGEGGDTISADTLGLNLVALILDGGGGNDVIRSNGEGLYLGGLGNDRMFAGLTGSLTETLDGGDGIDTLDTTSFDGDYQVDLATGLTDYPGESFINFENVTTGAGSDTVIGTTSANTIHANGGNDSISAGDGNDLLDGGAGADTMTGGTGNDRYIVDDAGDSVIEAAGEGLDRVESSVTFSLAGQAIENLTLAGLAEINATGNELDNLLRGNGKANILDGSTGADRMEGGRGEDIYFVDNVGDFAFERDGEGNDQVNSSVSYTLAGQFIEALTLTGAAAINGSGNSLANRIIGNGASNTLVGADGSDRLDGGAGADTLNGGLGNDVLVVDQAGDKIVELNGEGNDTVEASISFSLAGQFVELLLLTGSGNINGTGNGLANTLTGNAGNNILNGGAGADNLRGGAGDDVLIVDNVGDKVLELTGEGFDTVQSSVSFSLAGQFVEALRLTGSAAVNGAGNNFSNQLFGNGAANILNGIVGDDDLHGGLGADTLIGGTGADRFWFETALGSGNIDTISDFSVADDTIELDRSIFSGISANGALATGAFRLGKVALDADDRVLYDSATGNLLYDTDGAGGAAAVVFAKVAAGLAITNADFFAVT